ncbi:MAG: hypothetical protein K6F90_00565 [Lachnospiraceae bacterium]|nr:hypothetical protein [Lachnospiraceae bacterium]
MGKKRTTLKKSLITRTIIYVAIIVVIISQIAIKMQSDNIQSLSNIVLAGEMGRGFAVVASEVGTLATQSTKATETIRQLIEGVTQNIEDINKKADVCVRDMEGCLKGVRSANISFDAICGNVEKATNGIMEIAGEVDRINDVTSSNAATTEEQAANINMILGLSEEIVGENSKLRAETENITSISEDLNEFSEEIEANLSKYTV